jgi:hypothetical protein
MCRAIRFNGVFKKVTLMRFKYQGSINEKSSAQKLNQGAWKNVLKIIFP